MSLHVNHFSLSAIPAKQQRPVGLQQHAEGQETHEFLSMHEIEQAIIKNKKAIAKWMTG
jgi:hypothetical protein